MEQNLKGVYHSIKYRYDEFRNMCRVFNPERGYSTTTVKEIKERYKEISAKLAEARTLQQLLRGKYKAHVQFDPQLQRELEEFYLLYKKDYRYFEQNQSEWEQRELRKQRALEERKRVFQVLPLRILPHIKDVYRESPSLPSLILCFRGDSSLLETIKKKIKLGKRDIYEEGEGELWVFLAGIKPLEDSILQHKLLETFFQGLNGGIKGVAFKITKGEDGREETLRDIQQAIAEVKEGEIKIL